MDMTEYLTIKRYLKSTLKQLPIGRRESWEVRPVVMNLLKKLKKDLQEEKTSHLFVT